MSNQRGDTAPRLARVVVQGTSGSGKTTLAQTIATALGVQHLELDALFQQANWTPLDLEEFRAQVQRFVEQPRWVVDGNYSHVRDILWPLATTIVFIDLPRRVTTTRVIKRTFLRIMKREHLWNGNRESWRNALSRDPKRNIILWSWNSHARYHEEVPREARDAVGRERVIVLSSAREVQRFLDEVTSTS
ncbi:MAG: NACHT domain-containing protein [Acidimicrobiales bacterium]